MTPSTLLMFLLAVMICSSCFALSWAKPYYRRRARESGPGDVRFKIKGVDRGMLEINESNSQLVAHDWNTTNDDDRSSVWFAFCDENGVVDEIGHVGIGMQLCQADKPERRAVMDRHTKEVFVRVPRADDIILEVVIYKQQTLFLRPQGSENQILVAELQGTAGQVRNKPTSIHNHVRVVEPSHEHLRDFERDYDKYARWEIKVKRT